MGKKRKAFVLVGLVLALGSLMGCGFKPEKVLGRWSANLVAEDGSLIGQELYFTSDEVVTVTTDFKNSEKPNSVEKYKFTRMDGNAENIMDWEPVDKAPGELGYRFMIDFEDSYNTLVMKVQGADKEWKPATRYQRVPESKNDQKKFIPDSE